MLVCALDRRSVTRRLRMLFAAVCTVSPRASHSRFAVLLGVFQYQSRSFGEKKWLSKPIIAASEVCAQPCPPRDVFCVSPIAHSMSRPHSLETALAA